MNSNEYAYGREDNRNMGSQVKVMKEMEKATPPHMQNKQLLAMFL